MLQFVPDFHFPDYIYANSIFPDVFAPEEFHNFLHGRTPLCILIQASNSPHFGSSGKQKLSDLNHDISFINTRTKPPRRATIIQACQSSHKSTGPRTSTHVTNGRTVTCSGWPTDIPTKGR